jgi:hypothetical protein
VSSQEALAHGEARPAPETLPLCANSAAGVLRPLGFPNLRALMAVAPSKLSR